ncbi:MAG: hypothetical protein P8P36_00435 [Akkermansiaceae bacterium]|nr:hypothetical protein [Akkermansiaceae bacterium]
MNKTICILLAASGLSLIALQARTWTSADGSKTFEGNLKSYDKAAGVVKVLKGIREVSFKVDMLSEVDREWLESQTPEAKAEVDAIDKAEAVLEELEKQVIGSKIKKGVLSVLEDDEFVDHTMTYAPEYYVVYYSASW